MDEPSTSEESRIEKALLLYRQTNKDNQPFKLLSCWKVLRDEPKWINYNNGRFVKKEVEPVLVEGNPSQPEATPDRLTRAANYNKKQRTSDVKPLDDRLLRPAAYPQTSPAMAKAAAQKSQVGLTDKRKVRAQNMNATQEGHSLSFRRKSIVNKVSDVLPGNACPVSAHGNLRQLQNWSVCNVYLADSPGSRIGLGSIVIW